MEAKSVLKEFRQRRKLLDKLRENTATLRLKGMWDLIQRETETKNIISKIPPVEHLVEKADPGKLVEAVDFEEVVGIGFYIMKKCSETNKHITSIISNLGIGSKGQKPTRQSYVNDAMVGYINPALDFIEDKLEELVTTESKQKSTESDTNKITAAQTDERQEKNFGDGVFGQGVYGGKKERKDDENQISEEFQRIRLEPEQKKLLSVIVEAVRSVPRKKRRKFIVIKSMGGTFIHHDGLDENTEAYLGDIEILGSEGLLAITYGSQGSTLFDVTPLGLAYYDYMKRGLSKKQIGSKYDEGPNGGEEREDRENAEHLEKEVLDGQKRLLAKFKEFLVTQKGVPENELVVERVWVDEIRPLDLDVLFIREGDKTLAIIEYYFFESSLKQPEREQKLLKKYKEKVKLEGCPAYIACLAPSEGERLVDIYQVTEGEQPVYISNDDFPAYEDLRRKMETKTEAFGGEGGDEDFRNVFRDNLITFLITEKKYPRESLNYDIVAEAPDMDLAVAHPDTDDSLAVFDCKSGHYGKPSPEVSESMAKTYKSGLVGIQNPFAYIVNPSEESNEDFVIFEVEGDGTSNEISYGDFPAYNQLLFASPLSDPGRRICRNLTIFAKHEHGFSFDAPCQDYINLQIKKNKRTTAQIHRLNNSDKNIALVLAGYQKDFPEAKLPTYMFEGEVEQLSGYTSKSQGERNWLKGNLGHKQLKYEAGVYILKPGALVLNEIENEVSDLLELAKKNAERDKEPEEKKVSKYGKGHIATIQMDRLSEIDLLGRDKLIVAFSGMFVHTQEVEGFTVALLGDWGEGKSTVMKLLEKRLNEKHPGRFDFATFNAWEYEHTDNIAAGLSQEVVKGLKCKWNIWKNIILLLCFIVREHWKGLLIKILYLMIPGAVILSMYYLRVLPAEYYQYLHYGFWGVLFFASIYIFKNAKFIFEHPLLTSMETYLRLPDYGKHLGLIPVLKRQIKILCKLKLDAIRILKFKWGKDRKLIVFVDDLDRCKTDCIARVLDAIRLVMSIPNVIVMIGIDYRIAFKAMENYYEKLGDEERNKSDIARDYLGKIIQLPVRLMPSSPEDVRKYVEKRLFPDAQVMEDIKKDVEIDKERDKNELPKPNKQKKDHEDIGDRITDEKKEGEPKSVEEILKDTTIERDMFYDLAKRFNFTNPRQLLRLRNSYRFLKVMDSDEKYDREILMKILFWQEFLNNWPSKIRYQCEKSLKEQEFLAKIEEHEVKQIVEDVREDILKIIEMHMYEEIERFVNIVVLPHSESGIQDTIEEIGD